MGGGHQASSAVGGGPEVVVVPWVGRAPVDPHADPGSIPRGPRRVGERPLGVSGRRRRVDGTGEGGPEGITRHGDDLAPVGGDRLPEEPVVLGQHAVHDSGSLLPGLRASLQVCEEEGPLDQRRHLLGHSLLLQWPTGADRMTGPTLGALRLPSAAGSSTVSPRWSIRPRRPRRAGEGGRARCSTRPSSSSARRTRLTVGRVAPVSSASSSWVSGMVTGSREPEP